MRIVCFIVLLLVMNIKMFSQQTTPEPISLKEEYLQKSKSKKSAGYALLGTGAALAVIGIAIGSNAEQSLNGLGQAAGCALLIITGGGLTLTSLFFFGAANNYKRKAAAISLHMEKAMQPYNSGWVHTSFPTLRLMIPL
jgi:hypothetical protein